MDDLQLYGTSNNQVNGPVSSFRMISSDMNMKFGLDKCAKATFKRGTKASTGGIQLPHSNFIQELEPDASYT